MPVYAPRGVVLDSRQFPTYNRRFRWSLPVGESVKLPQIQGQRRLVASVVGVLLIGGGWAASGLPVGAAAKPFVARTEPTDTTTDSTTTTSPSTTTPTTPAPDPAPIRTVVPKRTTAPVKSTHYAPRLSQAVVAQTTSERRAKPGHVSHVRSVAKGRRHVVATVKRRKRPPIPQHAVSAADPGSVPATSTRTTPAPRHALASADPPIPSVSAGFSSSVRLFLLFWLLVGVVLLTVPATLGDTAARSTLLGERVARHRIDLAICGVATILVPAIVYLISRGA